MTPSIIAETTTPIWTKEELSAHLDKPIMSGRDIFPGTSGMTLRDVEDDILKGGRFLAFHWCLSLIVLTHSHQTRPRYVRSWQSPSGSAWFYSLLTMLLGWWSIHGIVYTPLCLWRNTRGGTDMTREVMSQMVGPVRAESILNQAIKKPLIVSQKLLIFFVIIVPVTIISILISAIMAA